MENTRQTAGGNTPPDKARRPGDGDVGPITLLERIVLGPYRHRGIRVAQWLVCVLVYVASGCVLWFGLTQGWMHATGVRGWWAFIGLTQLGIFLAIRSGWSERFADPSLTTLQIVLGVVGVEWAYLISGPVRGAALFPLLLIFTFGAFSLGRQRIGYLTVATLLSLLLAVGAYHVARVGGWYWSLDDVALRYDLVNVMMMMVLLPANSVLVSRLSDLRNRLRRQRTELTEALRLATRDELTGLANRRYMQDRLVEEHMRFQRTGKPFSIAVLDLDHFKRVNDRHGHAGGDAVLRSFAHEASQTLRTSDVMARWGGEEFLLMLSDTLGDQACVSLERLLERIRELPMESGGQLTFSAGVTEHRAGEPLAETIARADRAMYEAKEAGRDRVVLR